MMCKNSERAAAKRARKYLQWKVLFFVFNCYRARNGRFFSWTTKFLCCVAFGVQCSVCIVSGSAKSASFGASGFGRKGGRWEYSLLDVKRAKVDAARTNCAQRAHVHVLMSIAMLNACDAQFTDTSHWMIDNNSFEKYCVFSTRRTFINLYPAQLKSTSIYHRKNNSIDHREMWPIDHREYAGCTGLNRSTNDWLGWKV